MARPRLVRMYNKYLVPIVEERDAVPGVQQLVCQVQANKGVTTACANARAMREARDNAASTARLILGGPAAASSTPFVFAISTFSALTTNADRRVLMGACPAALNGLVDPKHPLCIRLVCMLKEASIVANLPPAPQARHLVVRELPWPGFEQGFI